nr:peptidase M48 [Cellvibrionaceae bacterium]
ARAVVYALLINCKTEVRETQLNVLQSKLETSAFAALKPCLEFIGTLPRSLHFTLIQLCLPAIKQLSQTQFAAFKSHLMLLLEADNQITLPEYCLYKIVVQNYQAVEFQSKYTLQERHQDISVLFSLVVYAGNSPSPGGAFKAAINTLEVKDLSFKLSDENFGLQSVEDALSNLCEVKLPLKQNLLSAVAAIIGHDGEVDSEAAELFRAIGDILDCPVPPILV